MSQLIPVVMWGVKMPIIIVRRMLEPIAIYHEALTSKFDIRRL